MLQYDKVRDRKTITFEQALEVIREDYKEITPFMSAGGDSQAASTWVVLRRVLDLLDKVEVKVK